MIVSRWQGADITLETYAKTYFETEGLRPTEEVLHSNEEIPDHRHPLDEIRIVMKGAMIMNIAGTQLLLRAGDRIEVPAHTRHSKKNQENEDCICWVAQKPF